MGDDHFLNLQPGTIVNGRYEIVKCLGTGSMGMVYACRHRELSGHLVAMKVLFTEVARDEVAAARFRNEIVASYGVSHPNVVRAYEYFRDGDLVAFTMEYIGGGDLADKLNAGEVLSFEQILHYMKQMCGGVQAIHDAGIIHRDLKPENILLTTQGDIKITDFGIARTGTGPKLTEHGGVVGTIDYVSPEYLERGQVDTRSDIYALGVLAYEMITGETPFQGKSVIETMTLRLRTDPTPPTNLRPNCPEELSRIVMKALRRDPDLRYQSASEMLRELENVDPTEINDLDYNKQPMVYDEEGAWRYERQEDRTTRNVERKIVSEESLDELTKMGSSRVLSSSEEKNYLDPDEFSYDQLNDGWALEQNEGYSFDKENNELNFEEPISGNSLSQNVTIAQSRLDVERLKNLSKYSRESTRGGISWLKYLGYLFIILLGLFCGMLFMKDYMEADSAKKEQGKTKESVWDSQLKK